MSVMVAVFFGPTIGPKKCLVATCRTALYDCLIGRRVKIFNAMRLNLGRGVPMRV